MNRQELLHEMAMIMFNKPYVLLGDDDRAEVEAEVDFSTSEQSLESDPLSEWQDILFEQMLRPENLVKQFQTMEEFKSWIETGRLQDLEDQLQDFVTQEYYEHACIIRDEIYKRKVNNALEKCEINLIN